MKLALCEHCGSKVPPGDMVYHRLDMCRRIQVWKGIKPALSEHQSLPLRGEP